MNPLIRSNVDRLHAYTPGEQPRDPEVVKLNTNENPYPPSPEVGRVLAGVTADPLRLYPDPGCTALRQEISRLHGCSIDQVFCGNGSDEILSLCFGAFVPDHGKVGYFDPSYSLYPVLAEIADCGVVPVPLQEDFTCPDLPADYDVPLFFWTNPNAPTSLSVPKTQIAAFADRSEGVVLVDEAYVDFAEADCMELALTRPNVLVTRSFSKSYSLAGIRLGYAIGHPDLIGALMKIKDAYNVNRLTQEMGRAAVVDQAHMRSNIEKVKATRQRVSAELTRRGFEVWPSQTNFLWVRPPHRSAAAWYDHLRQHKILIRYFPAERTRSHLRITIGTDLQMDRLLAAIDADGSC